MSGNIFLDKFKQNAAWVEAGLDTYLSVEDNVPMTKLHEVMRYSVLGGGKRLRATLVLETASLFDISPKRILPIAAAIEAMHAYSLIHDDLPAMDNDDLRRGKPTAHIAFDEASAICLLYTSDAADD